MARTKFAEAPALTVGLTHSKQTVRMPDGTKHETDVIPTKVGTIMVWVAQSTVDYKPKPRKGTLLNHGFRKGEYGLYLPLSRSWIINRTEETPYEIVKVIHTWRQFALGGKTDVCVRCLEEMANAGNPKDAKAVRTKYLESHGTWQVGKEKHTRMKGRASLVHNLETLKKLKRCPQEATDEDIKLAWDYEVKG